MGIEVWYRRTGKVDDLIVAPEPNREVSGDSNREAHVSRVRDAAGTDVPAKTAAVKEAVQQREEVQPDSLTAVPAEVEQTAQPVEFVWWRGASGMLLLPPMHTLDEKLIRDLVAALDWRANSEVARPQTGHFRWPQLASTTGTPARAVRAFLDAHAPDDLKWLLVAQDLKEEVAPYLEVPVPLETLSGALNLAVDKKELWQVLAR